MVKYANLRRKLASLGRQSRTSLRAFGPIMNSMYGKKTQRRIVRRRNVLRARPARFAMSKNVYRKNRAISSAMSRLAETKLLSVASINEVAPKAIQLGAIAYYSSFIMCDIPPGWDGNFNNLGGIQNSQGLGGNNRIGDYIYLKKTHLALQIDVNETSNYTGPMEYRMIVAKAKTGVLPVGYTYTPSTTLFLNNVGQPIGHGSPGVNGSDLMLQPINRRDWVVHSDRKFTLSSPDTGGGGMNYFYPSRKTCYLDLPYYAKTRINSSTNLPEDLDTHYIVMLYASCIGKDRSASDWEVSVRGTTSISDP